MKCPVCNAENPASMQNCTACGGALQLQVCPACPQANPADSRYCGQCGTALQAATGTPNESEDEAEHRQLTVLFADLVESTDLSSRLDLEVMREVIRGYQARCGAVIYRFGGTISRFMGDGILAYFCYPQAHEDDPERAVRAGLEIVESVREFGSTFKNPKIGPLEVRVGIATGPVVIGDLIGQGPAEEWDVVGTTPCLADRVRAKGEPGWVMVSDETHQLVAGHFEFVDLGKHALKGIPDDPRIWRVVASRSPETRFEAAHGLQVTPLVDRVYELTQLRERWELAKSGTGQVVLIEAEPGLGKSRMLQELREEVIREPHFRFAYQCSPHFINTSLHPFISQMKRAARLQRVDSPKEQFRKLAGLLGSKEDESRGLVSLVATHLGLPFDDVDFDPPRGDPHELKQRMLDGLIRHLCEFARLHPVLILFEDVQWADPTSLEALERVVQATRDIDMLLLVTSRPGVALSWLEERHVSKLDLSRFSRAHCEEMIARVAGKPLPPEVIDQIIEKTDGVALFVEEFTKSTLESGALAEDAAAYRLRHPLIDLIIPSTLHDSLRERLDRLSVDKRVTYLGATAGREFSYELLRVAVELPPVQMKPEELDNALEQLVSSGILSRRGTPPHTRFVFKHALLRDAAYESMLSPRRTELHARLADALESNFPQTVLNNPELPAYHCEGAGRKLRAIHYRSAAGRHAARRSTNAEAVNHYEHALRLLREFGDTTEHWDEELAVLVWLGAAKAAIDGYAAPDLGQIYGRALELCDALGDPPNLLEVLAGLSAFYYVRGELQKAYPLGMRCLQIATQTGDRASLVEAHRLVGEELLYLAEFEHSRTHLQAAIDRYDEREHSEIAYVSGDDPGVIARLYLAICLWFLGYPKQAREVNAAGRALANRLGHMHTSAQAEFYTAWLYGLLREIDDAHRHARAAVELCDSHRFSMYLGLSTVLEGWAHTMQTGDSIGVRRMRQGLKTLGDQHAGLTVSSFKPWLAEALWISNDPDEALRTIDEAIESACEHFYDAERIRLRGSILLALKNRSEAAECFRKARAISATQAATALELRAALELGALQRSEGRGHEAADMLENIRGKFASNTDCLDAPELAAAEAFLCSMMDSRAQN